MKQEAEIFQGTGLYALAVAPPKSSAPTMRALSAAVEVKTCPGPASTRCPAEEGGRCPLRDEARVSVVYLSDRPLPPSKLPFGCVTVSPSPVVVVLGGSDRPLSVGPNVALVGAGRGSLGVLEAVAALVDHGAAVDES